MKIILLIAWSSRKNLLLIYYCCIALSIRASAQSDTLRLSLKACVDYAIANHPHIRKATLEQQKTTYRVQELRSSFLPQVNANAGIAYNFELPTTVAPGLLFNTDAEDVGLQFGKAINTHVGVQVRQLAYSKAFSLGQEGIQQLKTVNELLVNKTTDDVAHQLAQRYYQALIVQRKRDLLLANLSKVEGLLVLIRKQYENGFAKKIDVDRLRVALSNLQNKLTNLDLQFAQLLDVIKYQMAMPLEQPIQLEEASITAPTSPPSNSTFVGTQKAELQLLENQQRLSALKVEQLKAGYYPQVFVQGDIGVSLLGDNLNEIGQQEHWYSAALLGVQIEMPLFDGHKKSAQIEQLRVEQLQQQEDIRFATQALELQHNRSKQQLQILYNNIQSLAETQEVAANVFAVMQSRYSEGVGTIMDLLDAETALREAQTNYLTALLEYKLAELHLSYAKGDLMASFQ
ncbi:MAG: TolC family protein [Bacteroidota bacterium]